MRPVRQARTTRALAPQFCSRLRKARAELRRRGYDEHPSGSGVGPQPREDVLQRHVTTMWSRDRPTGLILPASEIAGQKHDLVRPSPAIDPERGGVLRPQQDVLASRDQGVHHQGYGQERDPEPPVAPADIAGTLADAAGGHRSRCCGRTVAAQKLKKPPTCISVRPTPLGRVQRSTMNRAPYRCPNVRLPPHVVDTLPSSS